MKKFSRRETTTVVLATLVMLGLFGLFVVIFNSSKSTVSYIIDDVNSCQWEGIEVIIASEAFDNELTIEEVDADDEAVFLATARQLNTCTAKLGSTADAYSRQLNQQYEGQQ